MGAPPAALSTLQMGCAGCSPLPSAWACSGSPLPQAGNIRLGLLKAARSGCSLKIRSRLGECFVAFHRSRYVVPSCKTGNSYLPVR